MLLLHALETSEKNSYAHVTKSPGSMILLLCLIISTGRFVMDSYLPSIPAISQSFHISGNKVELTLTLYLLGFGFSQLIYGPVSDFFGRKKTLIVGILIFLVGSILCSIAPSLSILLIGRLLAGLGIGSSGVINRAIANDCFHGADFVRAWSYTTMTLVLILALAPTLGSWVQTFLGWRANFTLATICIGMLLLIIMWQLPETLSAKNRVPLGIKIFHNYHTIITTPTFLIGTLLYSLAFAGLISYFQVSSLLFIKGLGLTTVEYGYTSILIAFCYLSGGALVNKLSLSITIEKLLQVGALISLISGVCLLFTHIYWPKNLWLLFLSIGLYVIGARIIIPNALAYSLQELRHLGGGASGMTGFLQVGGGSFISYIISNFNYTSPLLLANLFLMIGLIAFPLSKIAQKLLQKKDNPSSSA